MTARAIVDTPWKGQFDTKKNSYVAGVLTPALYDPPVVKLSLRNENAGTEEVLTYGGSDTYDSQLTRISVGLFEWWFTWPTIGVWFYNAEWTETIGGQTVTVKGFEGRIVVDPDPYTWADKPVVTP
jgi:hypothetical protein